MTREEAVQFIGQSIKNDVDMAMVADAIEALSAIEDIKAEINEFIKNPQFGDLDIGASCGAVKCLEIIGKHIGGKESE